MHLIVISAKNGVLSLIRRMSLARCVSLLWKSSSCLHDWKMDNVSLENGFLETNEIPNREDARNSVNKYQKKKAQASKKGQANLTVSNELIKVSFP